MLRELSSQFGLFRQAECAALNLDDEGGALIIAAVIFGSDIREPVIEINVFSLFEFVPQRRAELRRPRLAALQRCRHGARDQHHEIVGMRAEDRRGLPVGCPIPLYKVPCRLPEGTVRRQIVGDSESFTGEDRALDQPCRRA